MTLTPPPTPPHRALPVLACINHTLTSTLQFRDAALRIGLPWIALLTVLNIAMMVAGRGGDLTSPETAGSVVPDLVLAVISILGASSIAVNWHRYILRDEVPQTLRQAMRLDAPVWQYAGYTLITLIIVLLPVLLVLTIGLLLKPLLSLVLLAALLAATMFMRLSVALPAKALEQQGFGIRQAIEVTRGNMMPFMGLLLVNSAVMLATLLAAGFLLTAALHLPLPLAVVGIAVISMVAQLFLTIFSVSLLSSLYGFFVERRNF